MTERDRYMALYARVSTKKQDETLQLPKLRHLAESKGSLYTRNIRTRPLARMPTVPRGRN